MAKLKDEAQAYEPKQTKNIADLDVVSLDLDLEDRKGTDKENNEFDYKVALVDGEEYRVPSSVLKQIKTVLEEKPEITKVKVVKKGTGLNTDYTVVPLI